MPAIPLIILMKITIGITIGTKALSDHHLVTGWNSIEACDAAKPELAKRYPVGAKFECFSLPNPPEKASTKP